MGLKLIRKFKHNNVTMESGYCYSFRYQFYENDPEPMIFLLYAIVGVNDNTGNRWNLIQGINLNYLHRAIRSHFIKMWEKYYKDTRNNLKLTWELAKRRFPYFPLAIRRYHLSPHSAIRNLKMIAPDNMQEEIMRHKVKDFSKLAVRRVKKK